MRDYGLINGLDEATRLVRQAQRMAQEKGQLLRSAVLLVHDESMRVAFWSCVRERAGYAYEATPWQAELVLRGVRIMIAVDDQSQQNSMRVLPAQLAPTAWRAT